jgi:hypothetical protein
MRPIRGKRRCREGEERIGKERGLIERERRERVRERENVERERMIQREIESVRDMLAEKGGRMGEVSRKGY